jgi:hypothetical protein
MNPQVMNPQVSVSVKSAWLSKINWTQAASGAAMILAYISGGKMNITPDQQAALVVSIGVLGNVATWVIKTWFTATVTPSSATQAPTVTASIPAKAAAILAILFLGAMFVASPGYAQGTKRPVFTGNAINDIAAARGKAATVVLGDNDLMATLAKPFNDLADFLQSDATAATALSTVIPALQDGHGQQCWIAMSTAGAVFKAHPVPLTLKVMTDIEALRLLEMTSNNLCANVHCTQVFADLTAMAQAASPQTLPIPSLHDLCSKIPQVALVDAITPPVVTPPTAATPTPAPTTTPTPAPTTTAPP